METEFHWLKLVSNRYHNKLRHHCRPCASLPCSSYGLAALAMEATRRYWFTQVMSLNCQNVKTLKVVQTHQKIQCSSSNVELKWAKIWHLRPRQRQRLIHWQRLWRSAWGMCSLGANWGARGGRRLDEHYRFYSNIDKRWNFKTCISPTPTGEGTANSLLFQHRSVMEQ